MQEQVIATVLIADGDLHPFLRRWMDESEKKHFIPMFYPSFRLLNFIALCQVNEVYEMEEGKPKFILYADGNCNVSELYHIIPESTGVREFKNFIEFGFCNKNIQT